MSNRGNQPSQPGQLDQLDQSNGVSRPSQPSQLDQLYSSGRPGWAGRGPLGLGRERPPRAWKSSTCSKFPSSVG